MANLRKKSKMFLLDSYLRSGTQGPVGVQILLAESGSRFFEFFRGRYKPSQQELLSDGKEQVVKIRYLKFQLASILMVGLTATLNAQVDSPKSSPLKVFILAGQSNMQGHAQISTFDSLAGDPKTAPLLKEMLGPDGKPRVCEKVWITSVGCQGDAYTDLNEQKGKLSVGYGAFGIQGERIGPEFTFGIYMEKSLNEPILIIKTAWGGRSLHTDFRPPSAGPYEWSDYELGRCKERGDNLEKIKAEKIKDTGAYYRHMIAHVNKVLKDIQRVVPDYDPKQGYELAGFIWFQGFNDLVSDWTYPNQMKPGGYDLYAELLKHFIKDVRKDLSAPKLPFVIGVMGIGGEKEGKKAPQKHFRQAQVAPLMLEEFKGNVAAVQTSSFWDDDLDALEQRMGKYWPKVDAKVAQEKKKDPQADSWENKMKLMAENFSPDEWKRLKGGVSNGGYHYLGAAKILAPIGKAFAEELTKLNASQQPKK
jgi:hypothetical protein